MFIFTINSVKLYSKSQDPQQLLKQPKFNNYLHFIVKCCPVQKESSIEYSVLISKLRKKFRLTDSEVKQILTKFIEEEYIIVSYDNNVSIHLLSNNNRKAILNLITKYPGIYTNVIKKQLHLGSYQTVWHISFLLEFNRIVDFKVGKFNIYALEDVPYQLVMIGFIILKQNFRKLIHSWLFSEGEKSIHEIGTILNLKKTSTYTAIKKLVAFEILEFNSLIEKTYILNASNREYFQNTLDAYNMLFSKSSFL